MNREYALEKDLTGGTWGVRTSVVSASGPFPSACDVQLSQLCTPWSVAGLFFFNQAIQQPPQIDYPSNSWQSLWPGSRNTWIFTGTLKLSNVSHDLSYTSWVPLTSEWNRWPLQPLPVLVWCGSLKRCAWWNRCRVNLPPVYQSRRGKSALLATEALSKAGRGEMAPQNFESISLKGN